MVRVGLGLALGWARVRVRPLRSTLIAMMMAICTSRLGTSCVERPMIMPTYLRCVGPQAEVRGVAG